MPRKRSNTKPKRVYKKRPRRTTSVAKLARQVQKISNTYKPELKEIVYSNGNSSVPIGQMAINNNAYYSYSCTPVVSQGTTSVTRVGSSIRLKSIRLMYQLNWMDNTGNVPTLLKWYLVRVKGTPITPSLLPQLMFELNPFVFTAGGVNASIIDSNSQLNTDFRSNYQIVKYWKDFLPMENLGSGLPSKNRVVNVNWKVPLKIQFDNNTDNVLSNQLVLIGLASAGNTGLSSSTLKNVPTQGALTGYYFNTNMRFQYYDD